MNLTDSATLLPLLTAGGYVILLASLLIRRRPGEPAQWLARFLTVSILWQLALLPSTLRDLVPSLPLFLLLVGTLMLGMTTAVYIDWSYRRQWFYLAGLTILLPFAIDLISPAFALEIPEQLIVQPTVGGALTPIVWLILSGLLLATASRYYQVHRMPWHANRLLYWAVALLTTFSGELILFFDHSGLQLAGQIIRLAGAAGLTYGVYSPRIFDVR